MGVMFRQPSRHDPEPLKAQNSDNKKRTGVARIQRHWLEPLVLRQRRAGPFPHAAHLRLARQAVPPRRDGGGVPVLEANIGTIQVDEELVVVVVDDVAGLLLLRSRRR